MWPLPETLHSGWNTFRQSRKFFLSLPVWKHTKEYRVIWSRISLRRGIFMNTSTLGKGMWRKKDVLSPGCFSPSMAPRGMSW